MASLNSGMGGNASVLRSSPLFPLLLLCFVTRLVCWVGSGLDSMQDRIQRKTGHHGIPRGSYLEPSTGVESGADTEQLLAEGNY